MAKYSKKAGEEVKEAMHEMKQGKLKSGRSGKKVTSRKQAIAIGLSEAREKGAKVPKKAVSKSRSTVKAASMKKASGTTGRASKASSVSTKKSATRTKRALKTSGRTRSKAAVSTRNRSKSK
jgi:hypothetical protein